MSLNTLMYTWKRKLGAIFTRFLREDKIKLQLVFFPSKRLEKQGSENDYHYR